MTFVRPAPSSARDVVQLGRGDHRWFERLVADDPFVNAVLASRLSAMTYGRHGATALGGTVLGSRRRGEKPLSGAVFSGGNLIPVGGTLADWPLLAAQVAALPRVCTSVVGRHDAVAAMWDVLGSCWGPPRAVRAAQPLLALRVRDGAVRADTRVRPMNYDDLDKYLPAASAMFAEELGVHPQAGPSYRNRIRGLIARRHAFGIVDDDGQVVFKADIGALSAHTAQLQGVWVRPDLRGHGLGTSALAAVIDAALGLAPSVSLYVNDFNVAACRVYRRLGMRQVATLSTVLL